MNITISNMIKVQPVQIILHEGVSKHKTLFIIDITTNFIFIEIIYVTIITKNAVMKGLLGAFPKNDYNFSLIWVGGMVICGAADFLLLLFPLRPMVTISCPFFTSLNKAIASWCVIPCTAFPLMENISSPAKKHFNLLQMWTCTTSFVKKSLINLKDWPNCHK